MGSINQGFSDRIRYTLSCDGYGSVETQEIIGWQDDDKEIVRNEDLHGVFANLSNNLKFYGDARDYLNTIYAIEGVLGKPKLLKEVKHPKTDLWEFYYEANLDLNERQDENGFFSAKFNDGGLQELLKSRESEQLELDRLTTMDGATIDQLDTKIVQLDGRKIFLQSKWKLLPENMTQQLGISSATADFVSSAGGIPITLIQKSHEEAQDQSVGSYSINEIAEIGNVCFAESIEPRQLKAYGNIKWKATDLSFTPIENTEAIISLVISRYNTPELGYLVAERRTLWSRSVNVFLSGQQNEIDFEEIFTLSRGESLAFEFYIFANPDVGSISTGVLLEFSNVDFSIDEDSVFEKSISNIILTHEVLQRLSHIITGKKTAFYSEFFGRKELGYSKLGNGGYTGITHGFWVRGFDKLPLSTQNNINPFKPLTTSMRDAIDSLSVTHGIGLGIEKIGFNERIRVEDKRFFYRREVTVKLKGQISNVTRSVAQKYNYSAVNIVYEGDGVYEEAFGLDEPNAGSNFTTCLIKENKLLLSSKWLWGTYKREFTRRKPKFRFGTTDTNGDNSIFGLDLKLDISRVFFRERKWQDDFSEEPTGIYDPESATNLRMSPVNLILTRHGWEITAGLKRYVNKFLRYASSVANSRLKTKLRTDSTYLADPLATPGNGNAYAENGDIINGELQRERYVSEFIEFDHEVGFELMQQIEGFTMIGAEKVYNKYGLFEFTNENGDVESGYLMSVKPNGNGRIKLLLSE